ncbi:hypothetical protein L249_2373 [Ophiocordyceps polyrhachis-furcata BCC 54312]|uniref:Uncharacterized protein n=1 Tax=Ophiocordyceps polyrhachis-furcata BCC 54312 TaxID=1330021 RepID=A0A367LP49_9HYPO|nr:hypothetical protein L249_2373 [Ophiocordyceps polyrhachis-furcata BCC 54312]
MGVQNLRIQSQAAKITEAVESGKKLYKRMCFSLFVYCISFFSLSSLRRYASKAYPERRVYAPKFTELLRRGSTLFRPGLARARGWRVVQVMKTHFPSPNTPNSKPQ